jgi:two-component system chemotaxis response regulator CheY
MNTRVLVVDDSNSMRQMIRFTLEEEGCEIFEAENGKRGTELLPEATPELIITDINMPEMNGLDFIRAVRGDSAYKFVPILVLTTESEQQKQEEGKQAGATAWLVKPFTPESLVATVHKLIA